MILKRITDAAIEPITTAESEFQTGAGMDWDSYLDTIASVARNQVEGDTSRACILQKWRLTLDEWPSIIHIPIGPLVSVVSITYALSDGVTTSTLATTVYGVDSDSDAGRIYLKYGQQWPTDSLETHSAIVVTFLVGYARSITFTAAVNDTCTSAANGLADGDAVYLASTTTLPPPLAAGTLYYVVSAATDTFKVALTAGGTAVDITGVGSGTHTLYASKASDVPVKLKQAMLLLVDHWFRNRSAVFVGTTGQQAVTLPLAYESLISSSRIWS